MILTGKPENLEMTCPSTASSTSDSTWIALGYSPGLHGERPTTNCLSHVTARKLNWFTGSLSELYSVIIYKLILLLDILGDEMHFFIPELVLCNICKFMFYRTAASCDLVVRMAGWQVYIIYFSWVLLESLHLCSFYIYIYTSMLQVNFCYAFFAGCRWH